MNVNNNKRHSNHSNSDVIVMFITQNYNTTTTTMWIKFNGSSNRRQAHQCICGGDACNELSKDYWAICDIRGTYCRTPAFKAKEWEALAKKELWDKLLYDIDDDEHKKKEEQKTKRREKEAAKKKSTSRTYIRKDSDKLAIKRSSKSIKLQDNYRKCVLIKKHLHPNNCNSIPLQLIASIDTRDQSRSPETSNEETSNTTCIRSSRRAAMEEGSGEEKKEEITNERSVRFIAWHHFHPKIIEKYAFNKKTQQYSYNKSNRS